MDTKTEEDKIRKALFELPKDDIIKMLQTGIITNFGLRCNYCIYKEQCKTQKFVEPSCGAGINEFLKEKVKI